MKFRCVFRNPNQHMDSTKKTENGNCIDYKIKMDSVSQGEKEFFIKRGEYSTSAVILVLPRVEKLAEKRCRFIVEKQDS